MYQPDQQAQPTSVTCVDTTASDVANRVSVDGYKLNPLAIRKRTGVTSGGITYGQAADAVKSLTNGQVILEPRYGLTTGQVRDLVVAGRGIGISIDCSVTVTTTRRTGSFRGNHTIYIQRARKVAAGACGCEAKIAESHWEYLVEDPGTFTAGYLWWSERLLMKAALARNDGRGINVLVGADTEGVTRLCQTSTGNIRSKPSATSTYKGRVPLGRRVTVISTTNGGTWDRDTDDGTGDGWHYVSFTTSAGVLIRGYMRGEGLRAV